MGAAAETCESTPHLQPAGPPPPAAAAAAGGQWRRPAGDGAPSATDIEATALGVACGWHAWLKGWRAKRDPFGLWLALVFHLVTVAKQWEEMPRWHVLFFLAYAVVMAALLAWQRSGAPSFAAWRDCVQAVILLDLYFNPAHAALWWRAVSEPPPAAFAHWPAVNLLLVSLAVFANTLGWDLRNYPPPPLQTVQLVLLPFAHAVALPAQVVVQLACVGRVVWTVVWGKACHTTYFTHPRTHVVLREWHVWLDDTLGLLYIRPLWPARTPAPPPAQLCCHVGSFFVLFLGLVVQLGLQASFERRLFAAYCAQQGRQRRQQDGRQGQQLEARVSHAASSSGNQSGPQQGLLTALDSCSVRLAAAVAGWAGSPAAMVLLAVGLWEGLGVCLGRLR